MYIEVFSLFRKKAYTLVLFILAIHVLTYLLTNIHGLSDSIIRLSLSDTIILLICGFIGLVLADKLNLFIYNPSKEFIKGSSKTVSLILLLSILLVTANEISWVLYSKTGVLPEWALGLNFPSAILISARAAIYEEIFFRLFLMTTIIYLLKNIISYKKSVLIGISVSALIFSVSIHSGSMISFASGLLLGFIFINTGIIPAILLHFVADAVPFITLAYLLAI